MKKTTTTIAAIGTPNTAGGVAMIRISGDNAIKIAKQVFTPLSREKITDMAGYTAAYGRIHNKTKNIDDGVLLVFIAPKSYTGENVAEIFCHGGIYVARAVLKACLDAGAIPAEAGEFTKRAVLNGKMTLTQAESIIDVINSNSDQYLAFANSQKSGSLYRRINEIADKILSVCSHINAWIDYPDEGLDSYENASHIGQLTDCHIGLSLLLKTYDVALTMREGVITSIVGKPNAGKSTLMNLLTGRERSIVTDIPGTTRDVIEETVNINGAILRLCDCAGIRQTEDKVEQIGIEYMYNQIESSSLILAVFDNSRPLEDDDLSLIKRIEGKTSICIINKTDLEDKLDTEMLSSKFDNIIKVCARDVLSLEKLSEVIGQIYKTSSFDLSTGFVANERQKNCIEEALGFLTKAINCIENTNTPLDVTGFLLENTLDSLYRLSGKKVSEEIISEVFKNFCVGK